MRLKIYITKQNENLFPFLLIFHWHSLSLDFGSTKTGMAVSISGILQLLIFSPLVSYKSSSLCSDKFFLMFLNTSIYHSVWKDLSQNEIGFFFLLFLLVCRPNIFFSTDQVIILACFRNADTLLMNVVSELPRNIL